MYNYKRFIYGGLMILFIAAATGIFFYKQHKQEAVLPLKERTGALANTAEWKKTKEQVNTLMEKIKANPENIDARVQLAQAYIQEGRVTGDHQYYDMAAMRLLNAVLKKEPAQYEALCLKSTVLLSQHHFSDGLAVAKTAQEGNPYSAYVYGLLIDANVELGHYDEAVKNSDKMVSIRPDLTSYSRISYLREIYGDNEGAIEAMKMAVQAGYPGLEQTSWCQVQLGKLYENKGDLTNAKLMYEMALAQRPNYPFALSGMARIEADNKNYKQAIAYLQQASATVNDYSFMDELSDVYQLSGQADKAKETAEQMIAKLNKDAQSGNSDDQIGHYADKELAYAYLKDGNTDKALEHALIEYNRRPNNIDVNRAVAWVQYKKGNYKEANSYIDVALKTNSQNPALLCEAGLIKSKAGNKTAGAVLIRKAMQLDPYLPQELTKEAQPYLAMN